jgi:RNA-directed DNA polymerase
MARAKKVKGGGGEPDFGHDGAMFVVFRERVLRLWFRTLRRRSNRHRVTWVRMYRLAGRWLPNPRIFHPDPAERLCVIARGRSPVR